MTQPLDEVIILYSIAENAGILQIVPTRINSSIWPRIVSSALIADNDALINPTCQLKHQIFKGIADNEECYFKKEAIWHYRMDGSEHSGLDH